MAWKPFLNSFKLKCETEFKDQSGEFNAPTPWKIVGSSFTYEISLEVVSNSISEAKANEEKYRVFQRAVRRRLIRTSVKKDKFYEKYQKQFKRAKRDADRGKKSRGGKKFQYLAANGILTEYKDLTNEEQKKEPENQNICSDPGERTQVFNPYQTPSLLHPSQSFW